MDAYRRGLMLGVAGGVALALAGCVSGPTGGSYTPTGDPVVDGRALMERAPAKDRVLWQYRTALAALRRGQLAEARELLDEALDRIENVYGPDRAAKRSRGTFNAEAKKTFIGEPYERVMAYYYRAVLYWMDGEPDNARACFRSGQLIDSDVQDQTYASDYVLLDYLDGFVTAKLGGDGSDAFGRAVKAARLARPAPYYTNWNAFFFVEMGRGPTKYAAGNYGEQLRFRPGSAKAARVRITVGGQTLHADPWDDLSFQATTRGGRVMDHVLANKAVFKRTTDVAGTAAIVGGAVMAGQSGRNSAADEVGAGLIVAGVLSKIVSAATTPAADTRAWEGLPQYLGFTATVLEPGEHAATVEFLDAQGMPVAGGVRTVNVRVGPDGGDAVVWLSDQDR